MHNAKITIAGLLGMAILWTVGLKTSEQLERIAPSSPFTPDKISVLFKGKTIKTTSLGFDNALADYFFLELIQYSAYQDDNQKPLDQVEPVMDAISELDPHFDYSYRFAWLALTTFDKVRPQKLIIQEAGDILKKGWKENPKSVFVAQDLAFHYFFYEGNFAAAADLYDEVAKMKPDVRLFPLLAARLRVQSGNPETALMMLENQLNTTSDPVLKENILEQLNTIKGEITARKLDDKVEEFKQLEGRLPESLEELKKVGLIRAVPSDGLGGTFRWNPETKEVESTTFGRMKIYVSEQYSPPWKKENVSPH